MIEWLVGLFLVLVQFGVPLALLGLGFFAGRLAEARHYDSIRRRETLFQALPVLPTRQWDAGRAVADARLVTAAVVVSADYFKRLLAGFRKIIGGRLSAYESLLDRARREALLRLKEQCPEADIIVNLRFETSTISRGDQQGGIAAVELLAYGTAITYR